MPTTKDIIEEATLPVYTVHGSNFQVNIPLDAMNASFPVEMQRQEAASRAIEVMMGINKEFFLTLDEGETTPYVGPIMLVYLKDTDPMKAHMLLTYDAMADGGFYKDATIQYYAWQTELKKIADEEKPADKTPDKPVDKPKRGRKKKENPPE